MPGKLSGGPAAGLYIFYKASGDFSIGANDAGGAQFLLAPDENFEVVARPNDVIVIGKIAKRVSVPSHLNDYVARLITHTHPKCTDCPQSVKQYVRYGASPRGGQAIILGAKVNALLEGRYNVAFDDVKTIAHAALRHRLLLNFEGLAEEIDSDVIITEILESTPLGT